MTYRASIYVGPAEVRYWANRARLFFAGCSVLEGTERVWIFGIHDTSIYNVEAYMRELFPHARTSGSGLLLEQRD